MKKRFIKISALLLILSLLIGAVSSIGFGTAAEANPVTFIDFEDGAQPFIRGNSSQPDSAANIVSLADGNKVIMLDGLFATTNSQQSSSGSPCGKTSIGYGLTNGTDGYWDSASRPTKVSFKFKSNDYSQLMFYPLFDPASANTARTSAFRYYAVSIARMSGVEPGAATYAATGRLVFSASSANAAFASIGTDTDGTVYPNVNGRENLKFCDFTAGINNLMHGTTNEALADDSLTKDLWNTFTCEYDWSKFDSENNYRVGLKITVTDIVQGDSLVYNDVIEQASAYASKNLMPAENEAISFGLSSAYGSVEGTTYVDDVAVWSENPASQTSIAPTPAVKAKGATMSVEETADKDINVKVGFDLSTATKIAELNGDSIKYYGALLKAGTVNFAIMRAELTNAIESGSTSEGFVLTKKDVATDTLPEIYTVTVTNSGESENLAKRLTAIGYVITESGKVYYSENSNTANGIENGVINKSSVGLLKDVFAKTYLPAAQTDATALDTALASFNSTNSTSYTADDVKAIVEATTVSTTAERKLLKDLHFLLNS